eukprot:6313039-Amphidinium_carterae.1
MIKPWGHILLKMLHPNVPMALCCEVHPPESPFRLQEMSRCTIGLSQSICVEENAGLAARHLLQNTGKDDRAETSKERWACHNALFVIVGGTRTLDVLEMCS